MRGMKRTPKETLEWLCSGEEYTEFWHAQGGGKRKINGYKLRKAIEKDTGRKIAAATMHRIMTGSTNSFDESTLATLESFFTIPTAMIRGEVEFDPTEEWGMDLTTSELKLIHKLRNLTEQQRSAIRAQIESMQPDADVAKGKGGGGGLENTLSAEKVTRLVPRATKN